jgi:hypothetical protein
MAIGLLGAAAILGGVKAASGITEGAIGARAAKKEQERIDDELKRLRKNRGLSAREKSAMEADQAARRAGIERTMQAQGDEQLAAQIATGGTVSGRDVFLREQAAQNARTQSDIAAGQEMRLAESQALAETAAAEQALLGAKSAAGQRRIANIQSAVRGGFGGAETVAAAGVQQIQTEEAREFELQKAIAEARARRDDELGPQSTDYGPRGV